MDVLGDAKQLQVMTLRKSQAIDYQVNPPIQVPFQYKDQANKRFPGGVMYVDQSSPNGGVRTATTTWTSRPGYPAVGHPGRA